jgi:(R,R)-butanediol dehydrogenase / meso-butanediol dehydrogenase / diacetyl reductase
MKVVATAGAGVPLAIEERPDPEPGTGELVVGVGACGICGSDLHLADLGIPGIVLGHELAGVTVVGVCMQPDTLTPLVALSKELTMRFVLNYLRADFERTLGALADDALDPAGLITDDVGLEDLPQRFEALKHPTTEGKVLVRPGTAT